MIHINLARPKFIIPGDWLISATRLTDLEKHGLKQAGLVVMKEDIERQLKSGVGNRGKK